MSTKKLTLASLAPWGEALIDPEKLHTAAELYRLGDASLGLELVEGRLVKMSPTGWEHNHLAYRISKIVGDYVDSHQLGEVCTGEAGFILHQQPDTVLGADVAFVQAQRLVNVDRTGFLPFAPDLAVEIASPSQFKPEMNAKAQELLEAGTRLVWVVWPKTKHIDVWRPNVPMLTRAATDSVEGYDVIPGFQYSVGNMFT